MPPAALADAACCKVKPNFVCFNSGQPPAECASSAVGLLPLTDCRFNVDGRGPRGMCASRERFRDEQKTDRRGCLREGGGGGTEGVTVGWIQTGTSCKHPNHCAAWPGSGEATCRAPHSESLGILTLPKQPSASSEGEAEGSRRVEWSNVWLPFSLPSVCLSVCPSVRQVRVLSQGRMSVGSGRASAPA